MVKLPETPPNLGPTFLWLCIIITAISVVVGGLDLSWNSSMTLLFHLPTLSIWNAAGIIGMLLFTFGSLWGMVWLVVTSLREVR